MQSPIVRMQRSPHLWEPHPLAHVRALAGFGLFGDLTAGVTGVKAGVQAGTLTSSIGAGAAGLVGAGAAAGSIVPIIGTAIGVIVALVASGVFTHKADPEVGNFNNAMALVKSQGASAVLNIQDKYLVLAGLFDLEPSQIKGNIPIYKKYGRMGEQKFVSDMCALIQSAANQGIITANDTVQSVHDKVVQPWIDSWGYGPMSDSNAQMIDMLILGLIGEYVSGQYKQRWFAVGGQFAFPNLPLFTLPQTSAVAPTASGTPVPTTTPTAPATPTGGAPIVVTPAQPAQASPAGFTPIGPAPSGAMLYQRPGDSNFYTYTNGVLAVYGAASSTVAPAQPAAQTSAVPVPAGFVLIGSSNNLPAYQGPDGYYYSWSGTTMSPLTGVLTTTSGQSAQVTTGAIGAATGTSLALPSLTSSSQQSSVPYVDPSTYSAYTSPTTPIPVVAPTQSAGVDTSALPSWMTWGAVAAVVGVMVMSARPAPGFNAATQGRGARKRTRR